MARVRAGKAGIVAGIAGLASLFLLAQSAYDLSVSLVMGVRSVKL
jgi:hypothetical protein